MQQMIVTDDFWELFPDAQINVLTVDQVNNTKKIEQQAYFKEMLQDATVDAKKYITATNFSENEVVAQWRRIFTQFKTKKGARSSIEALLKRVSQGRLFEPINPLVDLYNSISLRFGVPCGGEDIAHIQGSLQLGKAQGGESFFPLGSETDAPALPGEICYFDQDGAVCRCLNWREAKRTMLTEQTKQAVLVIEAITKDQIEQANAAQLALKQLLEDYFSIKVQLYQLTKQQPTCPLTFSQ